MSRRVIDSARWNTVEAIKSLSSPLSPMQETTMLLLTVYGVVSIAFLALWIKHRSVSLYNQKMAVKLGSIKGNLSDTSDKLDLLSRGVDTILSDAPRYTIYYQFTDHWNQQNPYFLIKEYR